MPLPNNYQYMLAMSGKEYQKHLMWQLQQQDVQRAMLDTGSGHAESLHVNQHIGGLAERKLDEGKDFVSSFTVPGEEASAQAARALMAEICTEYAEDIAYWFLNGGSDLTITFVHPDMCGHGLDPQMRDITTNTTKIVLQRNVDSPLGFFVQTSYPDITYEEVTGKKTEVGKQYTYQQLKEEGYLEKMSTVQKTALAYLSNQTGIDVSYISGRNGAEYISLYFPDQHIKVMMSDKRDTEVFIDDSSRQISLIALAKQHPVIIQAVKSVIEDMTLIQTGRDQYLNADRYNGRGAHEIRIDDQHPYMQRLKRQIVPKVSITVAKDQRSSQRPDRTYQQSRNRQQSQWSRQGDAR